MGLTNLPGKTKPDVFETDDMWEQVFIELYAATASSVGNRRDRNDVRLRNGRVFWQFDHPDECEALSKEYRDRTSERSVLLHRVRMLYGRSKAMALAA